MNQEIKRQWIAALRNPGLIQGKKILHVVENGVEKICANGVLCDLAYSAGIKSRVSWPSPFVPNCSYYQYGRGPYSLYTAPDEVQAWAGTGRDHVVRLPMAYRIQRPNAPRIWSVTDLNDSGGFTLPQIADIIEENEEST